MAELETPPPLNSLEQEPELNLLLHNTSLEEPIWRSLFQNVDEFFFPKKLPPLVLTSKPVPVRDIWGFYDDYKRRGALGSTAVHILAVLAIILATYLGKRIVDVAKPKQTVVLIAPDDVPLLQPSKKLSGGGGGSGGAATGGDGGSGAAAGGSGASGSCFATTTALLFVCITMQ